MVAPLAFTGLFALLVYRPKRALPDPAAEGNGEPVTIVLFGDDGSRRKSVQMKQVVKTDAEWRRELSGEQFAVARRKATEFSYHNLYWNKHDRGMYRCVCCGTAAFRSQEKFDSDTGWPSFRAPAAEENVELRSDKSLGFERIEVLCRKCEAHLGHVFDDGPPPTNKRFCLNSASLQFSAQAT